MTRKLERSRKNKMIAGVLGGLAEYFGHDPLLYRLAAVIGLILTGFMPGLLFYALAWFFIPFSTADYVVYE